MLKYRNHRRIRISKRLALLSLINSRGVYSSTHTNSLNFFCKSFFENQNSLKTLKTGAFFKKFYSLHQLLAINLIWNTVGKAFVREQHGNSYNSLTHPHGPYSAPHGAAHVWLKLKIKNIRTVKSTKCWIPPNKLLFVSPSKITYTPHIGQLVAQIFNRDKSIKF